MNEEGRFNYPLELLSNSHVLNLFLEVCVTFTSTDHGKFWILISKRHDWTKQYNNFTWFIDLNKFGIKLVKRRNSQAQFALGRKIRERRLSNSNAPRLTSSIIISSVGKPPDVSESHSKPDSRQYKVQLPGPVPSLLVLIPRILAISTLSLK